jgi:hypothetical protein
MALVLKWDVPVDNLPHDIGGGPVVHVATLKGRVDEIQVWTKEIDVDKAYLYRRDVQVIEGAHPFPNDCEVLGTVICSDGNLIYHVIELGK